MPYDPNTGQYDRAEYGLGQFMPDPNEVLPAKPEKPREGEKRVLDYHKIGVKPGG